MTASNMYGTNNDAPIRPMRVTRSAKGQQLRQRRIAIIAAMCAVVGLLVLLVYKVNPESNAQREKTLGHLSILKLTWEALANVWEKDHQGKDAAYSVPTDVNVMFGVDCCDPDMCSKYALERCHSNKDNQKSQDEENEDRDISNFLASTSSSSSGSSPSSPGLHSGAARAAAAMGLTVERDSSPLRSYYAQKREADEASARAEEASDAPAPTVGLIHRRQRVHRGALQAAEAFGLHLANVPQGNVAAPHNAATGEVHLDSTGGVVQSLLAVQELAERSGAAAGAAGAGAGGKGREQELEDVFEAPMRVAEGALEQGLGAAGGYIARDARHVTDAHAVTSVNGRVQAGGAVTCVDGCSQESDGYVTKVTGRGTEQDGGAVTNVAGRGVQRSDFVTQIGGSAQPRDDSVTSINGYAQGNDGFVTNVHTHVQRTDGMVTNINGHVRPNVDPDVVTQVDGFVRPSTGMVTGINARGVVGPDGMISYHSNLDANGQPACGGGPCPLQAGPLVRTAGSKGGLETANYAAAAAAAAKRGGPFGQWQAPEGWQDGRADDRFSITVQPKCGVTPGFPCPHAEAHLKVEVFCPPYKAPAHGAVWYKDKRYRTVTSAAAREDKDRKKVNLFGKEVAIAEDGDIPEGDFVKIECDAHYRLSEQGSEIPRCQGTGEFEQGKVCEPIMCDSYTAPPHGMVIPADRVMAGQSVTILCDEGYLEYYGEEEDAKEAPKQSKLRAVQADPWTDFSSWFAGPNQGRSGNLISMEAGQNTAKATVDALGASRGRGGAAREVVRKRLEAVSKQLNKVKQKERGERQKVGMSEAVLHMSESQLDHMVRQYVTGGGSGRRRLLSAEEGGEEGGEGGEGGDLRGEEILMRVKSGLRRKQEKQRRKRTPVCLDSGHFEKGILCRKKPLPPGPPPPAGAPVVPRGMYIVPLVCPSYIAPDHGSVWYAGKEYRIATASGTPATEHVRITCHEHYKPSEIGSSTPRCRRDGQWEVGKVCEPIYCADYGKVQFGYVSTHDFVRAGTRIQITCHEWYQAVGMEEGGRPDPMCLDNGRFEKGVTCVPKPCPKTSEGPCPRGQRAAMSRGIEPRVSKEQVKDWEDELRRPLVGDYNPNVFDHEPRPYSLDISTSEDEFNPLPWPPNKHFNPSYETPSRLENLPKN